MCCIQERAESEHSKQMDHQHGLTVVAVYAVTSCTYVITSRCYLRWEADSIPTNAIPTKIHIDRRIITLYIHIHQGATTLRVM